MTQSNVNTKFLTISHDHLVQAVAEYFYNNRVFSPLPVGSEIVDIDLGIPLDDDGNNYTLEISFIPGEAE